MKGKMVMLEKVWHKTYPPQVPHEIDFKKNTIPDMLSRTARKYPDNSAITFEKTAITYGQLNRMVNCFSRALLDLDVGMGQKVALVLGNTPHIVIASQAALRIGAIAVMINPLSNDSEMLYQIKNSGASCLIASNDTREKILHARSKINLRFCITTSVTDFQTREKVLKSLEDFRGFENFQFIELLQQYNDENITDNSSWDNLAAIIYTRGTTGKSKGVMLTHANLSCNVQQFTSWMCDMTEGGEVWPLLYPICHCLGFTMQNSSIYRGWNAILVHRPAYEILLEILIGFRLTIFPALAPIFSRLFKEKKIKSFNFSGIKAFMSAEKALPSETLQQLKKIRNIPVINIYGLTEASSIATATPWFGPEKEGSVGVPYPNTDLKIVDLTEGFREMPTDEIGEIILKGPQVMKTYVNGPIESEKILKDGWLYTGDIGCVDKDGYLFIIDRKENVIFASGFNVYPMEVDQLLCLHPKVSESCTIGIPHHYHGHTVKSYVVLKAGERIGQEELIEYCRQNMAPYKVPRQMEFVSSLPKNRAGKIRRQDLWAMYRQ
jgi:long-chain acyl-CoA synthetase